MNRGAEMTVTVSELFSQRTDRICELTKKLNRVVPFFIRTPAKDGRIPTPQSFGGTLWRKKSEGFIFWRRLWKKFPKGQFFGGSFDLKSDPPCAETCHP